MKKLYFFPMQTNFWKDTKTTLQQNPGSSAEQRQGKEDRVLLLPPTSSLKIALFNEKILC